MRKTAIMAACGVLLILLVWGPAHAETLSLTFEPFKSRVVTPTAARAAVNLQNSRYDFRISSSTGTINVAGSKVDIRVQKKGAGYYVGLDSDGDGSVGSSEYRRVSISRDRARPMLFKVKAGGKDSAVMITDLSCGSSKSVVYAYGNVMPGGCMKGSYNGLTIRLIDDNLDGEFTQNGKDAVAIGRAAGAVPLLTNHLIGKQHCRLKVSGDGDRLEVTPLEDVKLGQVKLPMSSSIAKSVVLAGKEGAYDVVRAGQVGIPGGEYKLAYGIVGDARSSLLMVPDKGALSYPIEAGMINTPRMGKPFKLDFQASAAGDTLQISPRGLRVIGAGGEAYAPIQFDRGGNASLPKLRVLSGSRSVFQDSMKFG